MTDFPTMVYRVPGQHRAGDGHTFDYRGIDDAEAMKAALADGWHKTFPEALAGVAAKASAQAVIDEVVEAQEAIDDVSPATRDELEQKARELGIGFNARTSDKVLAQRIAEAL